MFLAENKREIRTSVIVFVCAGVSVSLFFFIALKLSWRDFLGEPCFLEDTTFKSDKGSCDKASFSIC